MHEPSRIKARLAAQTIVREFGGIDIPLALQLGTGWGDIFKWKRELPFKEIPGFEKLGELPRHARSVVLGDVGGRPVLGLRGRVHCNEAPADPEVQAMVRLQIEMLLELGVTTLVATCAVGGLRPEIPTNSIVVADSFITLFAPDLPGFVGEFESPEDTLKEELITLALGVNLPGLPVRRGAHVMVRGPFFEGRKHDKRILASLGADVVGMSLLPEACVMSTRQARVLGLCFVGNDAIEVHTDAEISRRVRAKSALLGNYLNTLVAQLD